ncbi:MAG: hypothetical protein MUE40_02515 [Anaerolineae bacterium]|nr:hypothetical protein [Anaerolineae bacterium]
MWLLLALWLAGCEARATPQPAALPPTVTPVPVPTLPPPLRYGLLANTAGYVRDLPLLQAGGLVEQLADNRTDSGILAGYDIVAAFGTVEGWPTAPVFPQVALVLHAALPPLDSAPVREAVIAALNPAAITAALGIPGAQANPLTPGDPAQLRTALANAGYPDGVDLVWKYRPLPGVDQLPAQWQAAGLRVSGAAGTDLEDDFTAGRAQLLVIAWGTPEERADWVARAGAEQVIDLYTLPVSYRAAAALTLEFTPDGFPVGRR